MKLFIDPQFWVAVSFLICMGVLAKVMVRRVLAFLDRHAQQREQVLLTLKGEEKTFGILLKQEQQRALAVEEERKAIQKKLKDEIEALQSSTENRMDHDTKAFEKTYEKLHQNMMADFEHHLHATLVHNIMEGTREILRQPSMEKHQHKIVARHLKTVN